MRSIEVLLLSIHFAASGPLRIASNGVDSVVLGGNEKALIIDTSTSFRVERLDAPIERIEIRLMDENSTQPVVIDIQKSVPTQPPSSAEASSNSVIEPDTVGQQEHHPETKERKSASIGFEVKMERKVEHIMPNSDANRWNVGQPEQTQGTAEYVDDLPPLDIGEDAEEGPVEVPVERCYLNRDKLTPDIIANMDSDKRNLSRKLKQYNTQLRAYCSPEHEARDELFRNCPLWREEKMIHYYKLMRLLYCSDYNLWPNAPKIKRSFGANLQLFEKLYAFMPKQ
ncbi:hypothetical protein Tcan_06353 [Toxocara canis]|nr:hypothetical protein Tcan_06353 [Toxocara canis]